MKHLALLAVASLTGCVTDPEDATSLRPADVLGPTCWSTQGGQIVRVDLAAEQVTATTAGFAGHVSSLGLVGGKVVGCMGPTDPTGVLVVDPATHEAETIDLRCEAATSDGERMWVLEPPGTVGGLLEFDDLAQLRTKVPARRLPQPYASRLGVGEGRLLAAWHSADRVISIDLASGANTEIMLPGYDGWIFGLAEVGGKRYVAGGWAEKGIRVYDAASGAYERTLFPSQWFEGLACGVGGPPPAYTIDRPEKAER